MARLARIVIPGIPHHVTQRGNRRQNVFFGDGDYRAYLDLLAEWSAAAGLDVWAYCLMPNHVHLVVVPDDEDGLRAGIAEAHRRYTRRINIRKKWRGHLWQERFHSFPMDPAYLYEAVRYVELNPVRAGLVKRPGDWQWSSAAAHLAGRPDAILADPPELAQFGDWRAYLGTKKADAGRSDVYALLRRHSRTGRPLGSEKFIKKLEVRTGRSLRPRRAGRKPRSGSDGA